MEYVFELCNRGQVAALAVLLYNHVVDRKHAWFCRLYSVPADAFENDYAEEPLPEVNSWIKLVTHTQNL